MAEEERGSLAHVPCVRDHPCIPSKRSLDESGRQSCKLAVSTHVAGSRGALPLLDGIDLVARQFHTLDSDLEATFVTNPTLTVSFLVYTGSHDTFSSYRRSRTRA